MKIEFKSLDEKIIDKKITGKINVKANINIDTDTNEITISDERGRIRFNFTNKDMAKKWADAVA